MKKVKPALLRGFDQEYLPHEQLQFNALVDIIRRNFELFGFLPLETPSAERKEVLTSKGGVEKEIYALARLAAGSDEDEAATRGALRFDLTVPLARYVAMHERELAFPFRRYQIQRVWRGEAPQARKGRFREFYQCDIDIIGRDKLGILAEAEIPSVIHSVFREMAIGEFRIRINNRKVLKGLLQAFGVPEHGAAAVLRALDKVEREERSAILDDLQRQGLAGAAALELYSLIAAKRDTRETLAVLAKFGGRNELLERGLAEARAVVAAIGQFGVPDSALCMDLSVVRGLDYYTGTIYETTLVNYPELGSICSGGRYDDLAGYFTDTRLPGVGISIGLTRLFSKLREAGLLQAPARTPAEVLVTTMAGQDLGAYLGMARTLRGAGINTEVYLEAAKLKHQLAYAERKGFRVALIAGESELAKQVVQVKNLASRTAADCALGDLVGAVRSTLQQSPGAKGG
ncbi:MAG: histidine--tRNA ligase [Betaproteobacteria bacterium]|nr:histidine--tRNA ligase [Betaproteobacteria bacterium]